MWTCTCWAACAREVDSTGAVTAAYGVVPDLCAAVDVTHGDSPDAPKEKTFPLGKGPVIGVGPNCTRWMEQRMRRKAEELGMAVQTEVMAGHSGTNGWPLQVSREGWPRRCSPCPCGICTPPSRSSAAGTWRTWPGCWPPLWRDRRGGGVPMKELLKTLCALNGVSGDEDQVREFLAERARPWARSMKVDPLGNLIVWKKGARAAGDRLMLCAHMDEVGLIVTHVTEEGFLEIRLRGRRGPPGGHRQAGGPGPGPGARRGGDQGHPPGQPGRGRRRSPRPTPSTWTSGRGTGEGGPLQGGAGDLRLPSSARRRSSGRACSRPRPSTTGWAVPCCSSCWRRTCPWMWSSSLLPREEVGTRGAFGAAFSVAPETALVLETTTAADLPGVEGHRRVCAPGRAL